MLGSSQILLTDTKFFIQRRNQDLLKSKPSLFTLLTQKSMLSRDKCDSSILNGFFFWNSRYISYNEHFGNSLSNFRITHSLLGKTHFFLCEHLFQIKICKVIFSVSFSFFLFFAKSLSTALEYIAALHQHHWCHKKKVDELKNLFQK
mgnify:CR=1 FL=1